VRIVDDNDEPVETGVVGEMVVRCGEPWALNVGYYKAAEQTVEAWRNGWFHTGDALRRDADGNYFFVDRLKDALRRRGENISSFEVEREILAHPAIHQAAVLGVPSEDGEDDVLAVVSWKHAAEADEKELFDFLRPRLPHFMLPRYIRVLSDLPLTPTNKIQKFVLREEGITRETWDREAAGIFVKRERL
jgi:crotonobetaine/carnitine-CoA ligase